MKKLLQISLYMVTVGILISSCSPITITKRQHKKGYYTDFGFKNQAKNTKSVEQKTSVFEQEAIEELVAIKITDPIVESSIVIEDNLSQDASVEIINSVEIEKVPVTETKKSPSKIKVLKSKMETLSKVMKEHKQLKKQMKKNPVAGDARSLLWVIIVIILIVWLISFLFGGFGLGGLMNLLLLVALILLILWLLRVI